MVTGGTLWAFDVGNLGELRERLATMKKVRQVKGGRDREKDEAAEKEFEDFLGPSLRKGKGKGEEDR